MELLGNGCPYDLLDETKSGMAVSEALKMILSLHSPFDTNLKMEIGERLMLNF